MRDSIETLWRTASPLKRLLIAGVPAIIVALAAGGVIYASFSGGDGGSEKVVLAATKAPTTSTPIPPTKPPAPTATATAIPVSAGLQDSSGDSSSSDDSGGASADYAPYVPPSEPQSGPGPIVGTNWSLSIPAIGVDASIYSRTVGGDGQMGDPGGPWQVIWYDFAADGWTGLGGSPGQPGSNVVLAGHVDYIHVGPAVFWSIRDLQPGDIVTVNGDTGPVNYAVQWSQWAEPDQDFTAFVSQTGQESVTLVTCIGEFSAGHYGNRFIVRAVRV